MATEKFFVFNEDGELKRLKGRIVRFLDNEDPTGSDKSAIRTSLEVSPDAAGLVQADVGTAPNEIPVNGMLGDMAYQASDGVSAGTISADEIGVGVTDPDELIHAKATSSAVYFKSESGSTVGVFGASNTAGAAVSGSTTASDYQLWSANQLRWTISGSTGNLVANGTAIDFGSGATLSDYEEGTHTTAATPSSSGTITLDASSNSLSYTRVGRKITVSGALGVSAVSSPVGNYINFTLPLQIADLDELSGHFAGSCVVLNAAGSMGSYSIIGLDGESSFRLYKNTNTSAVATAPDFSGDETIYVSVTYFTTA